MAADARQALAEEAKKARARMVGLVSRLEVDADDLRTYARDGLIGIHPDQDVMRGWAALMEEAAAELAAAAEIAVLSGREAEAMREALIPFSKAARDWDPEENDGFLFADGKTIDCGGGLTVGHLRAARRALTPEGRSDG